VKVYYHRKENVKIGVKEWRKEVRREEPLPAPQPPAAFSATPSPKGSAPKTPIINLVLSNYLTSNKSLFILF
jgi:hypothetical protein